MDRVSRIQSLSTTPPRNPSRWRAVIHTQDVRHGTAGCLLSLILFAPLFVPKFGMLPIATAVLTYGLVIVPALTNYFSPIKLGMKIGRKVAKMTHNLRSNFTYAYLQSRCVKLHHSASEGIEMVAALAVVVFHLGSLPFVCFFQCFIPSVHGCYLSLHGFRVTSNQIVYFLLCEKLFCPEARLVSLYFLLFYTVLAYIYQSLVTRQWTQSFHQANIQDFLKLTSWFVVVRLGKAVALSFVLIVFSMQSRGGDPSLTFVALTSLYFGITQKKWTGTERIVSWFRYLKVDVLEEEEDYWIPFLLRALPIFFSIVPMMSLALSDHTLLCLVAFYTNFFVPFFLLKNEFEDHCFAQSICLFNFKKASEEDLQKNGTCPVCLERMRVARVTQCNHVYHALCLRKCLQLSPLCPLCKRHISHVAHS